MSTAIDKLFEGMAKADASGKGTFMEPGLYVVETKSVFVKNGFKGPSFIVEFSVVESNNDKHKPGTSGSWVLKFSWPATFGHITKFVFACLGIEPTKWNLEDPELRDEAELVARVVSGSEPAQKQLGDDYAEGMLTGIKLRLECVAQKTAPKPGRPEGGDFTAYHWAPLAVSS